MGKQWEHWQTLFWGAPGPSSQGHGFSCGHVWMWEPDYKESWALKNQSFWTVGLEKILESPLDCKEIWPAHPKGNQSWVFVGGTDVEAETPILDAESWLIWKDPNAGKDWGQEEKGDDRGWDGWMASLTQWKWVCMGSGSWWWTGRPGVLRFMGSQSRTWLSNWNELNWNESDSLLHVLHFPMGSSAAILQMVMNFNY